MGRILLLELVGRIDGGLRLTGAVVDVDHVKLRLPGDVAERIPGLELLEVGQRRGVVAGLHGCGAALVEFLRARGFDHPVAAVAAPGGKHHRRGREEQQFRRRESSPHDDRLHDDRLDDDRL